jgi:hypothetical protein
MMRNYDSEARKAEYWFYKEHGICVRCHHEKAIKGKTLCPECTDKVSVENKKRYLANKEKFNERKKKQHKDLYERRKANGVCVRCGKRPPKDGLLSCTQCLIKQAKYKAEAFERKGGTHRWLAIDLGLCAVCCKSPKMNDKKVCKQCYDHICTAAKATGAILSERRKHHRNVAMI